MKTANLRDDLLAVLDLQHFRSYLEHQRELYGGTDLFAKRACSYACPIAEYLIDTLELGPLDGLSVHPGDISVERDDQAVTILQPPEWTFRYIAAIDDKPHQDATDDVTLDEAIAVAEAVQTAIWILTEATEQAEEEDALCDD